MEFYAPAGFRNPAPFALVGSLYGHFANGAAGRIIFAPDVDTEVRKGGIYDLIKIPNSIQPTEVSMERNCVNSALMRERLVHCGPVMRIFLTYMFIYRRPLKPNDFVHRF